MVYDHTYLCFFPFHSFIAIDSFFSFYVSYASHIMAQECQKKVETLCLYMRYCSVSLIGSEKQHDTNQQHLLHLLLLLLSKSFAFPSCMEKLSFDAMEISLILTDKQNIQGFKILGLGFSIEC
jgi:hypothetical protein